MTDFANVHVVSLPAFHLKQSLVIFEEDCVMPSLLHARVLLRQGFTAGETNFALIDLKETTASKKSVMHQADTFVARKLTEDALPITLPPFEVPERGGPEE